MNFDWKRYKTWDWAVLGAFVVAIIGISIPWWHAKVGDGLGGALGGSIAGISFNLSGWSAGVVGTGKATFALMLIALVLVVLPKALFRGAVPSWYKESWVMMGLGGLLTILGIVGCAKPPLGGFSTWGWRPGSLITLIAALGLGAIGYFMYMDKTGAYDGAGKFELPANVANMMSQQGGQQAPPAGGATPPAEGGKFCVGCGKPLDKGAAFCKDCGKQV
jgi:hypothetical protein